MAVAQLNPANSSSWSTLKENSLTRSWNNSRDSARLYTPTHARNSCTDKSLLSQLYWGWRRPEREREFKGLNTRNFCPVTPTAFVLELVTFEWQTKNVYQSLLMDWRCVHCPCVHKFSYLLTYLITMLLSRVHLVTQTNANSHQHYSSYCGHVDF